MLKDDIWECRASVTSISRTYTVLLVICCTGLLGRSLSRLVSYLGAWVMLHIKNYWQPPPHKTSFPSDFQALTKALQLQLNLHLEVPLT